MVDVLTTRRKGELDVTTLVHPLIWFELAPAGLKLETRETGDPARFADTLACGSVGHIIGIGVVLGLKNIGAL